MAAISKFIEIDGRPVLFAASAATPRIYRALFGRDLFRDIAELGEKVSRNDENASNIDMAALEKFQDIAYLMAKQADPENVPNSPDEWLDGFGFFSIYQVLPQIIGLWSENIHTDVEKKTFIAQQSGK